MHFFGTLVHICIDASGTRYSRSRVLCWLQFFVVCFTTSGFILRPFSYPLSSPVTDFVLDYYSTVPSKGFLKNICAAQKCVHSRLLRTSLCEHMILFWLATPSSFAPILKRQLPEPSIPCYTWYRSCSLPKFYLSIDNSSLTSTVFRFSVCWWCKFRCWFTNVSSLVTFLCLLSLN